MMDMLQANWMAAAAVAVLVLLVAAWLLRRATTAPPRRDYKPDVLDEGAAPAQRNQALIDAPPAAQIITPPPFTGVMAGVGEVIAVTAQDEVEELEARAAEMEVVPEVEEAPEPAPAPEPEPPVARVPAPEPQPSPVPKPEVVAAPAAPPAQPRAEPVSTPAEPATAPAPQPSAPAPTPPRADPVAARPSTPSPTPAQAPTAAPTPAPAHPEPAEGHAPTPAPALASSGGADDLSRIKGLGPKLQVLLPSLGITTYAQIAGLSEADLDALDPQLGPFAGRPRRDSWVEQAGYLASGDVAGFEAKFGKV